MIALQEMNLAFKYPIIFWNCACLINDAGGVQAPEEDEEEVIDTSEEEKTYSDLEEFSDDNSESDIESSYEEEDADGYPSEVVVLKDKKKKKITKTTNYGKISTAIGKMKSAGIEIVPPDINSSDYTFSPDVEHNVIRYGLSGITRVGDSVIEQILGARPFKSLDDFVSRIKLNKTQMINLIKAGAFTEFGERTSIMRQYIESVSDCKKRVTLQNMKMLIDFGLIPDEYDMERRIFNFNKYLKKNKIETKYYKVDEIALNFLDKNGFTDNLIQNEYGFVIKQTVWDKIYKQYMDKIRPFIQKENARLLKSINDKLVSDNWNKYCQGSISKWEMDSISCYIHEHELARLRYEDYGLNRFDDLPQEPEIERYIPIKGKLIPIFRLARIYGTVLDRDKLKKTVTLLTIDGVVTVKIYGGVFSEYDKQISEVGADGHKHVIRKSEFARGTKIIVTGLRDGENEFRAKKYSRTPWHLIETIESVDEDGYMTINNRNDEEE